VKGIHVGQEQGAVVVTARGELDAFNAADLSAAFDEAGDGRVGRIVIDLSRVSFLDSTALGLVVRKVNDVLDLGGGASVVLPETNARRIFEITTLDRVLPIATSRRDALLAFGDSGKNSERGF
jgi:anti-anti-sigma factor